MNSSGGGGNNYSNNANGNGNNNNNNGIGASAAGGGGGGGSREEALRRMSKLVNSLLARGDCAPFREPVDWRGLELYDYPKIIKKMMDLGTVKRKLERNQYRNAYECAQDIRLIWKNCKTYNADGSDFYLLAESFSRRFEERYRKIRAEFDTGEDDGKDGTSSSGGRGGGDGGAGQGASSGAGGAGGGAGVPPSLEIKTRFSANLFRLSGMELGHVMQILDLRCPQALEHPAGFVAGQQQEEEDSQKLNTVNTTCNVVSGIRTTEVEINVDAIDSRTFAELDKYVREKVGTRSKVGNGRRDDDFDVNDNDDEVLSSVSSRSGGRKRKR